MPYRSLRECVDDLAAAGRLLSIEQEVDPYLEPAEIHRRVCAAGGPAVYFARVKGCRFPLVSNLFGTAERTRWLFRHTLPSIERLVRLKVDPAALARHPLEALRAVPSLWNLRPRRVTRGAVLERETTISELPQVQCWPRDGGAYVLLPQVYTEHPDAPGWRRSNLGMYRVQLSGGQYQRDREIGLHYQIHRGIGVHHAAAIRRGEPLRVNIFVGGPPALTLAAVMPLPEGLPELAFAGVLGGRRVPLIQRAGGLPIHADADFCISGTIDPDRQLPEGPFGDHLGYYSLAHDFPVMRVDRVYHRPDAIWPFTVVGRPPQEDTAFGQFIHELTGPVIPTVVPGVRAIHAVDAAGVHPLLLAIGSERYVPYERQQRPREILTQANAILGQGQLSLAKYLLIAAQDEAAPAEIHDVAAFLRHVLERFDPTRDLHFQTSTTIDTLDYSGTGLNEGSKLVIAAAGPPRRQLPTELPPDLTLPDGYRSPRLCLPGILAVEGPTYQPDGSHHGADATLAAAFQDWPLDTPLARFPLIVVVDDSQFTAQTLNNLLWVTFTRSNPAADVYGVGAFIAQKHWGCRGPLVVDARTKPHHAPPLEPNPEVTRRVDALAARGGPLWGILGV